MNYPYTIKLNITNTEPFIKQPIIDCPDINSHYPGLVNKFSEPAVIPVECKDTQYENSYYIWYKNATVEIKVKPPSIEKMFLYESTSAGSYKSKSASYTSLVSIYFIIVILLLSFTPQLFNFNLITGRLKAENKTKNNRAISEIMNDKSGFSA